jgi:hypothetical protein
VAIAVVLAPQIALAIDDPTGTTTDPVNAVTGTTTDPVNAVTGTTTDPVNAVTGTVNDATGQITGTVETTAGSVTGDPAHLGSSATTSLISPQEAGSTSKDPTGQRLAAGGSISRSGSSPSGAPRFAGLRTSEANYVPGGGIDTRSEEEGLTPGDPCESDQRMVCLGVLYGLGEFGDVGGKVIANLAQTGVAALGLAALALLLAIAGSSALAASSRRVASIPHTD